MSDTDLITHPTFKLRTPLTVMGLELKDIALMALAFASLRPIISYLVGVRLGFLIAALVTWVISRVWVNIKDNIPEKFIAHFGAWLSEVDYYEIGIDNENYPLIIDANKATELLKLN